MDELYFESKNVQESLNIVKEIIELCIKNCGVVDDSNGMLAKEMPMITELLSRICDYNAHFSQPISGSISLVFNSPFLTESSTVFLEKSAFS
jgi:hypothetical protein